MEIISLPAGSGRVRVEIPSEWVTRAFLEGGEKLQALIEVVKEMERFDFNHVVYPELVKKRERKARLASPAPVAQEKSHEHTWATISKKSQARGVLPYCLTCGTTP